VNVNNDEIPNLVKLKQSHFILTIILYFYNNNYAPIKKVILDNENVLTSYADDLNQCDEGGI